MSFIDMTKICRCCMGEKENMQSIYNDYNNQQDNEEAKERVELAAVLMICASVFLEKEDNLPSLLCSTCEERLSNAYQFKQECEKTDRILSDYFSANSGNIDDSKNTEKFECTYCSKRFKTIKGLSYHKRVHTGTKLKCTLCKKTYTRINHLKRHMLNHDAIEKKTSSLKKKKKNSSLKGKIQECSDDDVPLSDFVNIKVEADIEGVINIKTETTAEFEPHSNEAENGTENKSRNCTKKNEDKDETEYASSNEEFDGISNTDIPAEESKLQYNCSYCSERFQTNKELRQHLKTHPESRQTVCDICKKEFKSPSNLKGHMQIHVGKKSIICEECGKLFYTNAALNKHKSVHSKEKPFVCSYCGKAFTKAIYLKQHERVHTGETPFKCKLCDKAYKFSICLSAHEKIHSGIKDFKCKFCPKAFYDLHNLKNHERVHTGEKPFKCKYCGKSFPQSTYVNKHIRLVHTKKNDHVNK